MKSRKKSIKKISKRQVINVNRLQKVKGGSSNSIIIMEDVIL